nr:vascular endothelial growth factor A, long form isoform X4 [Kogia breviceps]
MAEGEQKPHEVVKFMDVYQRSYCRPIETLVDIFQEYPDEIEYIFKPSCVPLMRCGGCCNDEGLECVPTEEFNITMQIMRIKPHQGQHIGEMSFLQHNKCECRPKKDRARQEKKSVRGKGKGQKRKRKKSRYKSWSAYVVPPLSRFPEPPQPPVKLPPAGPWNPASLLLPFPGSCPPSSLVSLSHSHSTNWHRWVDVVVALLVQGWGWAGGQSGPGGFREGPLAWLGTHRLSLTHWALVAGPCWHGCRALMPAHPTGFHCSRLPHFSGSWGVGVGRADVA